MKTTETDTMYKPNGFMKPEYIQRSVPGATAHITNYVIRNPGETISKKEWKAGPDKEGEVYFGDSYNDYYNQQQQRRGVGVQSARHSEVTIRFPSGLLQTRGFKDEFEAKEWAHYVTGVPLLHDSEKIVSEDKPVNFNPKKWR